MRYATTLTLAVMSASIAFLMEWRDVFAVFAAIMVILIGLPVLSLASNFWFGETPPQVHVFDHYDENHDRLSRVDRRDGRGRPNAAASCAPIVRLFRSCRADARKVLCAMMSKSNA